MTQSKHKHLGMTTCWNKDGRYRECSIEKRKNRRMMTRSWPRTTKQTDTDVLETQTRMSGGVGFQSLASSKNGGSVRRNAYACASYQAWKTITASRQEPREESATQVPNYAIAGISRGEEAPRLFNGLTYPYLRCSRPHTRKYRFLKRLLGLSMQARRIKGTVRSKRQDLYS